MGGEGSKSVTVGYWYYVGMHMIMCHGPVNEVSEIHVGDKIAWTGKVFGNQTIYINQRELFGGEDREGGIVGNVDVCFGDVGQPVNDYLASRLPRMASSIPAFRGVLGIVLRQVAVSAMNPYIKPWGVKATRRDYGWYPEKRNIDAGSQAVNGVHLIRECMTNKLWGMGYNEGDFNDASWRKAADTLHAEGFGLSLLWDEQATIKDFISEISNCIDAAVYVHPRTGLFEIKLARDDYDPKTVPLFNDEHIISVDEMSRPAIAESVNCLNFVYWNGKENRPASLTVQNLAAIHQQGGVSATTVTMDGITSPALASRVAMRELQQMSSELATVKLTLNRAAATLLVGDVFKVRIPEFGFEELILRVVDVNYGLVDNSAVRVVAVQDIFGMAKTTYLGDTNSGWENPVNPPAPAQRRQFFEAPYYAAAVAVTGGDVTVEGTLGADFGFAMWAGSRPTSDHMSMELLANQPQGWTQVASGAFSPSFVSTGPIEHWQDTVPWGQDIDVSMVSAGDLVYANDEFLQLISIDFGNKTARFHRGLFDTVPKAIPAGTVFTFNSNESIGFSDGARYVNGESEQFRILTKTGKGVLAEGAAPQDTLTFRRRYQRPLPPGNLRIGNNYRPVRVRGWLDGVRWSHRNRRQQTSPIPVYQTAGNITPEAGTTYTAQLHKRVNTSWVLFKDAPGLTVDAMNYGRAEELADYEASHKCTDAGSKSYPEDVLSRNPLAYWPMGDLGAVAVHEAISGYDGVLVGSSARGVEFAHPTTGPGVRLNAGTPSYMQTAVDLPIPSGDVTVELLVRPTTAGGSEDRGLFGIDRKGRATASGGLYLWIGTDRYVYFLVVSAEGTNYQAKSAQQVVAGQTYHVAGVLRGTTVEVWLHGAKGTDGTLAGTKPEYTGKAYFGAYVHSGAAHASSASVHGVTISDAAVYPYALPGNVIMSHTQQSSLTLARMPPLEIKFKASVWAVRDALTSWQTQEIEFDRSGYGINYNTFYGD